MEVRGFVKTQIHCIILRKLSGSKHGSWFLAPFECSTSTWCFSSKRHRLLHFTKWWNSFLTIIIYFANPVQVLLSNIHRPVKELVDNFGAFFPFLISTLLTWLATSHMSEFQRGKPLTIRLNKQRNLTSFETCARKGIKRVRRVWGYSWYNVSV